MNVFEQQMTDGSTQIWGVDESNPLGGELINLGVRSPDGRSIRRAACVPPGESGPVRAVEAVSGGSGRRVRGQAIQSALEPVEGEEWTWLEVKGDGDESEDDGGLFR